MPFLCATKDFVWGGFQNIAEIWQSHIQKGQAMAVTAPGVVMGSEGVKGWNC